ncbi:TRAP transporter substrate-binding protein [Thermus thalpophilus]
MSKVNRRQVIKAGLGLLGATASAGFVNVYAQSRTYTLRFANYFPAPAAQSKLVDQFAADVQKLTEGRVRVETYHGGTLLGPAAIYDGVVQGVAHLGLTNLAYNFGRFAETEILDLPLGFPNAWVATHVAHEFYERYRPREWADTVVITLHASPVMQVFSAQKPVRRLEDLKGMTLRGVGYIGRFAEALGATARPIPMPEAYDNVSKRVIDGLMIPYETLVTFRLGEVIRYVTEIWQVGQVHTFYIVANRQAWNGLPQELRDVITNYVKNEFVEKLAAMWNQVDIDGYRYAVKDTKVDVIQLSQEEISRFTQVADRLIQDYTRNLAAKGVSEGEVQARLRFIRERIAYWLREQERRGIRSSTGPASVRVQL